MKLLVIGPDMRDRSRIKNFTGQQAYYVCRELRKRGVELEFIQNKFNKPPQTPTDPVAYYSSLAPNRADHVLALGLRFFTTVPPECAGILKTKVRGQVTQMHDGVVHEKIWPMPGVDCTFMFRDDATRGGWTGARADRNWYIGWAADPDLLYPEQTPGVLRIVIDHPYYKSGTPDWTAQLTEDVIAFAKRHAGNQAGVIDVWRLANGGMVPLDFNNPVTQPFDRKHIPFEQIAADYRKTNVFIVTHKESVGLTCLEMGYCGALTVTPKDFIPADRLATVRNVEFIGEKIPWSRVLRELDVQHSAEIARRQTWEKVADRMLAYFKVFNL